ARSGSRCQLGDDIRGAILRVCQTARFFVVKAFAGLVEIKLPASQTVADVGQVAQIGRDNPNLDVRVQIRVLSTPNGGKKIGYVGSSVGLGRLLIHGLLRKLGRIAGIDAVSVRVERHPALVAVKQIADAVPAFRREIGLRIGLQAADFEY